MSNLEEVKEYWDEDKTKPKRHYFLKDGKYEGEHKQWHGNGQLGYHSFYKNGKLEGEHKQWHRNGQLWKQCSYEDGKLSGEYKSWHEDGQLWAHYYYENGKIIDLCTKPNIFNAILDN